MEVSKTSIYQILKGFYWPLSTVKAAAALNERRDHPPANY
jgi:hypothetical protein